MVLALIGVVAIQYYFFQNTLTLKEAQFRYSVNMALSEVSAEVQRHEARQRIHKNRSSRRALDRIDSIQRVISSGWTDHDGYYMRDTVILTDEGSVQMSYSSFRNLGEDPSSIRSIEIEPQMEAVFDDVWLEDMLSGMMDMDRLRPLRQRLDFHVVDSIVGRMFEGFGIDADVDLAVFNAFGQPVLYNDEEDLEPLVALSTSDYRVKLNPNEIISDPLFLHIRFPSERKYIMNSLWPLLLTSGSLMLIIMAAFAFTVYIIFRQKRISEIKNDFINNMTHELKTPVSTIALACEALNDPDMKGIPGSSDRFVGMIQEENKRLGGLVENVLQSAIVDRGQLKLNKEPGSMNELIQDSVKHIQLALEKRGGTVQMNLSAKQDQVLGDKVHLQNVLGNLLDNAMKYSPENPRIEVRTEDAEEHVKVQISDQGIGIAKEHLKRIFDTLFRVPTGNTHDVKGFGLGLSYVKSVVDKHGGHIEVDSEPGKGSRFTLYIPSHGH